MVHKTRVVALPALPDLVRPAARRAVEHVHVLQAARDQADKLAHHRPTLKRYQRLQPVVAPVGGAEYLDRAAYPWSCAKEGRETVAGVELPVV